MVSSFCHLFGVISVCILSAFIYYVSNTPYHAIASSLSQIYPGSFTETAIYNASLYYNWTYLMRDNYEAIRDEFYEYERSVKSYCHQNRDYATNWDQKWTTVSLYGWGYWESQTIKYFPKTTEIIKQIQDYNWIRLAEFSILQSGKFIPRHKGVYAGQLTYQFIIESAVNTQDTLDWEKEYYLAVWDNTSLPLTYWPSEYIPSTPPSLLTWIHNGSDVLFDDSCIHEAFNNLTKRRVVLIIDPERTDDNFKNSYTAQIIHKYVIQWFIPILRRYQEYLTNYGLSQVLIREDINPFVSDESDNCKFEGVIESMHNYIDYNEIGNYNLEESNASSVRMPWYKVNDSEYIYNISQNSKHSTAKHVNFDKVIIAIVSATLLFTFVITQIFMT